MSKFKAVQPVRRQYTGTNSPQAHSTQLRRLNAAAQEELALSPVGYDEDDLIVVRRPLTGGGRAPRMSQRPQVATAPIRPNPAAEAAMDHLVVERPRCANRVRTAAKPVSARGHRHHDDDVIPRGLGLRRPGVFVFA